MKDGDGEEPHGDLARVSDGDLLSPSDNGLLNESDVASGDGDGRLEEIVTARENENDIASRGGDDHLEETVTARENESEIDFDRHGAACVSDRHDRVNTIGIANEVCKGAGWASGIDVMTAMKCVI